MTDHRQVFGRDDLRNLQGSDFVAAVAAEPFSGWVDGNEVSIEVGGKDDVVGVLEQFAVSGLAGPKRGVGLAESAMRHFERRQALDKELFGGLGHSGPLLRSGQTREDFRQSLVMQRSHLQNPQAVREGLAAKFVGVPKTGFSAAGEIVFECACVLLR